MPTIRKRRAPTTQEPAIRWVGGAIARATREFRPRWYHRLWWLGPRLRERSLCERARQLLDYKGRRFPYTQEVVDEAALAGIKLRREPHE